MSSELMQKKESNELSLDDMFSMEAPKVISEVKIETAIKKMEERADNKQINTHGIVKIKEVLLPKLDEQVDLFLEKILSAEGGSNEINNISSMVRNLGTEEIKKTSSMTNRMLEKPMSAIKNNEDTGGSTVSASLLKLRKTIDELDPSKRSKIFGLNKFLKLIPGFNKVDDYFQQYKSSQGILNEILESIYRGKDELLHDNASIEIEPKPAMQSSSFRSG